MEQHRSLRTHRSQWPVRVAASIRDVERWSASPSASVVAAVFGQGACRAHLYTLFLCMVDAVFRANATWSGVTRLSGGCEILCDFVPLAGR